MMTKYDYKAHAKAVKQYMLDEGYATTLQSLNKVDIGDDGKVYYSTFNWVPTHIRLEDFEI